jgi:Phage portal protein
MRLADRWSRRAFAGYWEGLASGAATLTTSYGPQPNREALPPQMGPFALQANASSSIVFAAVLARISLFSQATFQLQAKDDKHLWGRNTVLSKLEEPWPGGTTGDLLARMEQDVSLFGNAYIWEPPGEGRLVRLRPDWVTIESELVHVPGGGTYRNKIGYWHEPPKNVLDKGEGFEIRASEVVHWTANNPDPAADFRGMSWLTPAVREIQGDQGMTAYKIQYLSHAATPNLLIRYSQKLAPGTVDAIRERVTARYGGVDNAFKTLVLDQGADTTVVGNSLQQMDFSGVSAVGVERILADAMVPGVLVGLEPLRGAGRGYQESMQKLANLYARPQWRSVCGALSQIVDVPAGNRLWFDESDIAALQDGILERGQAQLVNAQALLALVQAGYTHESAVAALVAADPNLLQAGGLGTPATSNPVQHMLPQQQPGVVATPLPPAAPRLGIGPASVGDGGDNSRPTPRPSAGRRGVNGHGQ